MEYPLSSTPDFAVTGFGDSPAWANALWQDLRTVAAPSDFTSRFKALYSETGLYFWVDNTDRRLACTLEADFANLFREDVIEVFLQPDSSVPVYFEYEISPLGFELPLLVSNHGGNFHGWLPWHYEGPRQIRRAARVRGGEQKPMAECTGWSVEFFIPFALLKGLGNQPVAPGTRWRANVFRIDYDGREISQFAWDARVGRNFHDYANFGTLVFG